MLLDIREMGTKKKSLALVAHILTPLSLYSLFLARVGLNQINFVKRKLIRLNVLYSKIF